MKYYIPETPGFVQIYLYSMRPLKKRRTQNEKLRYKTCRMREKP
jgi:hypothetical protein